MTKYRYRWPIIIGVTVAMWAGIIYAVKADGLDNAAVLAIDRIECGIDVPQLKIDTQIVMTAKENGLDAKQAVDVIAAKVVEIQKFLRTKSYEEVLTYCAKRAGY